MEKKVDPKYRMGEREVGGGNNMLILRTEGRREKGDLLFMFETSKILSYWQNLA